MTGRDLILYILTNGLEDEPIVKDGQLVGFLTVAQVAEKMNVGTATVYVWISLGRLKHILIGERVFVPANFELLAE